MLKTEPIGCQLPERIGDIHLYGGDTLVHSNDEVVRVWISVPRHLWPGWNLK